MNYIALRDSNKKDYKYMYKLVHVDAEWETYHYTDDYNDVIWYSEYCNLKIKDETKATRVS